jgi:hypothetical protein
MHRFMSIPASFRWKLCLALAIVFLGDHLFYENALFGGHIGMFAFAVLLCLVLGRPSVWARWQGSVSALLAGAFSFAMILDPGLLSWTMFWIAISMAALFGMTTPSDDGWLWFQRLLLHTLRTPVAPFLDMAKWKRAGRRPRKRRFSLRAIGPLLALPLAGSAIILTLFSIANPVIADVLAMIEWPDLSAITPWRMIFWLMLFALAWSVLRPRVARRLIPTFDGSGDLPLPGVSVASVTLSLILFNALFAIQNGLDIAYLSRALPFPAGMTMTEYVHRGAYPLIVTALLAALFVLVTLRPGSSTAAVPMIRRLVVLWIFQNLILVGSSVQRTLEYVDTSMLTTLRIQALAWMALVAAGLVFICWRMFGEKSASWLINTNLGVAGLVLTTFCFVDEGELAAQWNVRHAREVTGIGRNLDLCYLYGLGPSALLPLIELEGRPIDPAFKARAQWVRSDIYRTMIRDDSGGWWTWRNAQRLAMARERLKAVSPVALQPGQRDCDGALIPSNPEPEQSLSPPITADVTGKPTLTGKQER